MTADITVTEVTLVPSPDCATDFRAGLVCPDCGRGTLTRRWWLDVDVAGVRRAVVIESCPCDAAGDAL